MKKLASIFGFLMFALLANAQENNAIEMATGMRSSGKIYVVVAVICVVFLGIATYMFSIDRKISQIEKREEV